MLRRTISFAPMATLTALSVTMLCLTNAASAEIQGHYIESRTCQVYTGPCFANAEVGLAGKGALLAWDIGEGKHAGVDLSGLRVVMALRASKTLEFRGIEEAGKVRSVIYVDDRANTDQRLALVEFAKQHAGKAGEQVVRVTSAPIEMSLDVATLSGQVKVGKDVRLQSRKARPDDCICSNEAAYYPPLVKVENCVPGVATVGEFRGRGLGSRWSTPGARSVYMATFVY